jgi:hypothetical protein
LLEDVGVLTVDFCLFDVGDAPVVDRLLAELSERFVEFVSRVIRFDVCEGVFERGASSSDTILSVCVR